ncbi:Ig-like domain-containing protein [Nocardioides albertanoniae]|uniref:Ig-like domain-containing protein n=1 Tax=Nocardioides albertanoniae TaxID=1175486 RepID=A0A543ABT8_9ACTN|nr:CHAP domain-containing protein [Nocardioides albertanoniae]TQL70029.1 Ig-like domain-containing protein [Nocardioides albertanoniae]
MGKPGGALRRTLVAGAVLLLVGLGVQVIPKLASPAQAGTTMLCSGFSDCRGKGYSTAGYENAWGSMYWRMYAGRNCTNYAAYRMIQTGLPNARPWSGEGNATNWGVALSNLTNRTPSVGAIAWWHSSHPSSSRFGHVAYVERVSSSSITISESNYGSDLSWRKITKGSRNYPTGFIHFNDQRLSVTKRPTVSGTAQVGRSVTVNTGSWKPNPNKIRYQWIVDRKPIPGATNKTYHIPARMAGKQIAAVLTGTRRDYTKAKTMSEILPPIKQGTLSVRKQPRITGAQKVGSTIALGGAYYSPGARIGEIRWYAGKKLIARGKSRFLKVPAAADGKRIGAVLVGVKTGYRPKQSYAFASSLVGGGQAPKPPKPTEPPQMPDGLEQTTDGFVKGGTRLGGLMQVDPGKFSRSVKLSYQWTREGTPISGATTEKYRPTSADVGHRLSVTVVAKSSNGSLTKTYGPSGRVRVKPSVKVIADGGSKQADVVVKVTAPGYAPTGSVKITTNGGRTVTKSLTNGSARVTFVKLPAGEYAVKAAYSGDAVAYWASGGDFTTVQ